MGKSAVCVCVYVCVPIFCAQQGALVQQYLQHMHKHMHVFLSCQAFQKRERDCLCVCVCVCMCTQDVDEADPIQVCITLSPTSIPHCSAQNTHPTTPTPHHATTGAGSPAAPLTSHTHHLCITVTDTGGGLSQAQLDKCRHWFSTTNTQQRVGYGYSRDHGAQFAGLGVGMPLSRVYARLMGGKIEWEVDRSKGTTCARLCLPVHGFAF